jgi:hypothetical protein
MVICGYLKGTNNKIIVYFKHEVVLRCYDEKLADYCSVNIKGCIIKESYDKTLRKCGKTKIFNLICDSNKTVRSVKDIFRNNKVKLIDDFTPEQKFSFDTKICAGSVIKAFNLKHESKFTKFIFNSNWDWRSFLVTNVEISDELGFIPSKILLFDIEAYSYSNFPNSLKKENPCFMISTTEYLKGKLIIT